MIGPQYPSGHPGFQDPGVTGPMGGVGVGAGGGGGSGAVGGAGGAGGPKLQSGLGSHPYWLLGEVPVGQQNAPPEL